MSKPVTLEMFKSLFPKAVNHEEIHNAFKKYFSIYEINTDNRRAGFLAQCGHESSGFSVFKENLNYSAEGLLKIFPKYFKTLSDAQLYARKPEKIANRVYANRMSNGNETSGDGWRFKGAGFIQLTGKANYTAFAKSKGIDIDEVVLYLSTIEGAVESALYYWKSRNINSFCDKDDIIGMTKSINGGTIGLADRTELYNKIKSKLKG